MVEKKRFIKVKVPLFEGAARTICVYDSQAFVERQALLVAMLDAEGGKRHSLQELKSTCGVGWNLPFFVQLLVEPAFDVNLDGTPTEDIIGVKITVSKRGVAKYKAVYSLDDCYHDVILDNTAKVKLGLTEF